MSRNSIELYPKQIEFAKAAQLDSGYTYLCLAGSTGAGKTDCVIFLLLAQALHFPGIKIGYFRKRLTTIRSTTLVSFADACIRIGLWDRCKFDKRDNNITLPNGSMFMFREADIGADPELKKIRGLQLTHAVMEEGDEMDEKVFSILLTRINRYKNVEYKIPGQIYITLNPSDGWVKTNFYEKFRTGKLEKPYFFMQMSATDNPNLPQSFFDGLAILPDEEKARYLNNNWDYKENIHSLIKYQWLKDMIKEELFVPTDAFGQPHRTLQMMGVDAAREGKDRSIWAMSNGWCSYGYQEVNGNDNVQLAQKTLDFMQQFSVGTDNVFVDTIGLGAGVLDVLKHNGHPVQSYKSSEKPFHRTDKITTYKFANRRAESYWILRELIREGQYWIVRHPDLVKELTNINWFRKDDGRIYIESKIDIRKRLGYSPDYSDAVAMSITPLVMARAKKANGLDIPF